MMVAVTGKAPAMMSSVVSLLVGVGVGVFGGSFVSCIKSD